MQIVIKIPDDFYERVNKDGCMSYTDAEVVVNAFYCGVVLPKGHGRLIDADAVTKNFQAFYESFVINTARGGHFSIACLAPTILEADKEEADADSD